MRSIYLLICFLVTSLHSVAEEQAIFIVPNHQSAEFLLDHARSTLQANPIPKDLSRKEWLEQMTCRAQFQIESATAALAAPDLSVSLKSKAYLLKFEGLEHLARTDRKEHVDQLESFLDELDRLLPDSKEAKLARSIDLQRRCGLFLKRNRTVQAYRLLESDILSLMTRSPVNFPPNLPENLLEIAELAEQRLDRPDLFEEAGFKLLAKLRDPAYPELHWAARTVEEALHVPGIPIEIRGLLLNGNNFDLRSLRGKIVLIDFFTSWCVPCIEEFPRLKELLTQYEDQGLTILGVGMDDPVRLDRLVRNQKLPWPILCEQFTVSAGLPSLEKRYRIKKYPTAFLIDREGNLIEPNARGEKLESILKKECQH